MTFRKMTSRMLVGASALSFLVVAACGDDDAPSGDDGGGTTPAEQVCELMASQLQQCGPATPCDEALVQDCAAVVGIVSEAMLANALSCLEGGGTALSCLAGSAGGLSPTETHIAFAGKVCDTCTGGFGADTCKEVFFNPDSEFQAGAILLPFSDGIVQKIADGCVTDLLSCGSLLNCVQTTLAQEAIPENTVQCVVDGLLDPGSFSGGMSTCGGGGGMGPGSGGAGTGASGTGGTGTGAGGGGDACLENCNAVHPSGLDDLANLYNCLSCSACYDACDGASSCPSGQELGCSAPAGGDCGACINSACAQGDVCAFETETCFNNPECNALNDCYLTCP
jgi:hypothetical protein